MKAVIAFILVSMLGPTAGGREFDLVLQGIDLKSRDPVFVRGFASFPSGAVSDLSDYGITDRYGKTLAADLIPTAYWPDRSIRYLAIKAVAPKMKSGDILRWVKNPKEAISKHGIKVSKNRQSGIDLIDTGPLRVAFARTGPSMIKSLEFQGQHALEPDAGLELSLCLNGDNYRDARERQIVHYQGAAELELVISGNTASLDSYIGPSYEIRFWFYPNSAWFDGRIKIQGEIFSGRSNGISMRIQPVCQKRKPGIKLLTDSPNGQGGRSGCADLSLIARGGHVLLRRNGRETPFQDSDWAGICVRGAGPGISLGLADFRRLHPWRVDYQTAGKITLSLLSRNFDWEEGFYCERDFILGPGSDSRQRRLSDAMRFFLRSAAFALPETIEDRSVPFARLDRDLKKSPLYAIYINATQKLIAALEREQVKWDGFRDYGDYRTEFGHYANNEFDPGYGLLKRFLIAGNVRDLALAETVLLHGVRYDRTGSAEPEQWQGVPWVHGEDHRSGDVELGHMWVDGLLQFYFLSGDPRYCEAALSIGRCMAGQPFDVAGKLLERSAAWSLMALTALVDAGFTDFENAMNRAAALIRKCQSSYGFFRFGLAEDDNGSRFSINAWVTAGITVEALYRHYLLTGDVRSCDAVIKAGTWLVRSNAMQRDGTWCRKVWFNRVEKICIPNESYLCRDGENALIALGLARAGQLSGERYFLKLAGKSLEQGMRALIDRTPEYPGKALALIGRAAPDVILACRESGRSCYTR